MFATLLLLLGLAHAAVSLSLPPEVDRGVWFGPAALAGVVLDGSMVGPRASIVVTGDRWRVDVVDEAGDVHVLHVSEPRSAEAREDLLATIRSLAEPVDDKALSVRRLIVPPPAAPSRSTPAPRDVAREVPRTTVEPETSAAQTTLTAQAEEVVPSPGAIAPLALAPEPAAEQDSRPAPVASPTVVLDEPVAPEPGWTPSAAAGLGMHLRPGVQPALRVIAGLGLHTRRLGVDLGVALTPAGRRSELGPLRWWTEVVVRGGVGRVGDGLRVGGGAGLAIRRWSDARGPVATTAMPVVDATLGWALPVRGVAVVPRAFVQADLGRTDLAVDGDDRAVLAPITGGVVIEVEAFRGRE